MSDKYTRELEKRLEIATDLLDTTMTCEYERQCKQLGFRPARLSWGRDDMTLGAIVSQLKACGYTCEGGPLELNTAFIALCKMAQ